MIAALCLGLAVPAAPAAAQTVRAPAPVARPVTTSWVSASPATSATEPTTTTTNEGAYERLSVGNRKIARAIFEAQKTDGTGQLTLDDIAAMKRSGQGGWGRIDKDMQARGLVTEKNLGQAVSRYNRQHHASRSETTTAANRTADTSGHGGGRGGDHERGGSDHGGKGGSSVSHGGGHGRTVSDAGSSAGARGGVAGGHGKSK
ncbi:MAG: hypothetical protein HYR51_12870 [Candidatus Rokubacteria bacterium]|nr:hypothetical protein [Candidatus Rokubacteria bacterium]